MSEYDTLDDDDTFTLGEPDALGDICQYSLIYLRARVACLESKNKKLEEDNKRMFNLLDQCYAIVDPKRFPGLCKRLYAEVVGEEE